MSNTRERILETALALFAEQGYEAVSVSAIASALGITKGALYKHYTSKRDIFDCILKRMEAWDARQAEVHELPEGTLNEMENAYAVASLEQIIEFSRAQFLYWTQDSFAAPFRRMLTLEQYRSSEMNQLYQQYLCSGPLGYMEDLFSSMGFNEAKQRSLNFYAPMFMFYSIYDGAEDKQAVLAEFNAFMNAQYALLSGASRHRKEK